MKKIVINRSISDRIRGSGFCVVTEEQERAIVRTGTQIERAACRCRFYVAQKEHRVVLDGGLISCVVCLCRVVCVVVLRHRPCRAKICCGAGELRAGIVGATNRLEPGGDV